VTIFRITATMIFGFFLRREPIVEEVERGIE
jgi:hypothetical protein